MVKYLITASVKKIVNNWFVASYIAKKTKIEMLLLVINRVGIFS